MSPTSIVRLYDPPKVGGDILAYCSRCKIELAHVVVSMIDSRPAKVMCKTCRGQHNYKRITQTSGARPVRSGQTSRVPRSIVRASEYWEQRLASTKGAKVRVYKPANTFVVGDCIQHAKFGVGIVEEIKRNAKIVVLFRDGEKVLIHTSGIVDGSQ